MQCAETTKLLAWLASEAALPAQELLTHVYGCAICHTTMVMFAADLLGTTPTPIACHECEQELPIYVDTERAYGMRQAVQQQPSLWWHVCFCPACSERYTVLQAMLDAVPLPDFTRYREVPSIPVIELTRRVLHAIFGYSLQRGTAWGSDDLQIIEEQSWHQYQLVLTITPADQHSQSFVLTARPPLIGTVQLQIGTLIINSHFDQAGQAHFAPIATNLLAAVEGPALKIIIDQL